MKKYILIILCCLTSFPLWSYNVNMIVEHYSVDQGLPNNTVNCTLKDRDGFIWFGTWYGLCCFDGVKFKTFNKQEHDSDVPPRKIQRIVEDKNGYIWVKTIDRKLYVFNKVTECFHAVYDDMKNYSENIQVIKLQNTAEGDVLLLTKDKNLLLAGVDEKGQVTIKILFDSRNEINKHDYTLKHHVLCETEEYISWIGTDYKVAAVHKGSELASRPADFITSKINSGDKDSFTSFFEDGRKVWVGDRAGIFYSIDVRTGLVNRYVLSEIKGAISNLLVTPAGYVYLSVAGQGTYEYDLAERRLQKINTEMNDAMVTHAFIDQYDKIWFHENEKALIYYDPLNHTAKRFPFTMFGKITTLYSEDAGERGLFFLSPAGEAWLFDREHAEMVYINKLKQLSNDRANQQFYHLMLDNDGVLWLSSADEGVYCMNFPKKQFNLLSLSPQSVGQENYATGVRALFQSKSGDIWVGTRWQSVYRMDRNGVTKHVFSTGDEHIGNVYHIMEDDKGNLWFSTKGNGLVKAEPDMNSPQGLRFVRYKNDPKNPNSISSNDVYFTYQDSQGRIWVGLLGGGLNLISEANGTIAFKHKYNGLKQYPLYGLYMEVRTMTEDNDGRIWVGTMDGLMSFDGHFTNPEEIQFETYRQVSERSNVADNDIYVLYKDSESQIWVSVFGGGLNKLVHYDKERRVPVFKSYGIREGMNNDVVKSIVEDKDGNLWFTTEIGLSCFNKDTEQFRNYDRYDGFLNVELEESSALRTLSGDLWLGSRQGILTFSPNKLETQNMNYDTRIVDFKISNRDLRSFHEDPVLKESITFADAIRLKYNQSMFTIEFAALNFYNPNRVFYRYILEGYEKEWHYNGKNRIASYTNVPPGSYTFRVETIDEANPELVSNRTLAITILPPWWLSWWAIVIYVVLGIIALYFSLRLAFFMIKMKNDIYIEQKVSEMKIKFFTNISHELRTPLTLIKGPIQELREHETLSPKGVQYVELMEKNTNQMLQLVNQILDFRKIQNGKMRLHVSLIDFNELVVSFQKEFRVLSEENEVSFTFQLPDAAIMIWADKEKLSIVIRNIISNAFKFTPSGGSIHVVAGLAEDGEHCFLRVEDNGIGIPQNKLTEVFERFSQGENAKNSYYQGTGIGLALSKEIVNLHHGVIRAESPEGKGTVFIVELLLGKEHYRISEVDFYVSDTETAPAGDVSSTDIMAEEDSEEQTEIDASLPNLLLVEDNKDLCQLIKLQLEDKFNIHIANNGVEGLKKVHLYHPDIVVTDQMMPEMDGLEMLQSIRKDFQISHIPVIILTAKNDEGAKTKAITLGANAYITKPFSKEYLLARIDQLLSERLLFRERIRLQMENQKTTEEDSYEQYLVKKDVQFLEKIHQVIEENMDDSDFNIDTIASGIGLSRSAFFKKLKSLTGLAPVDLVKEIRLNKSVELIKNTDLSISEIAFAVGFKDSGYYSKCFRKKYNQTPREYMSEWRKGEK